MSEADDMREASDLIANDKGADLLLRAVGQWLLAESVLQLAMPKLLNLVNVAIETEGGQEATLSLGTNDDGELEMKGDTNRHALAVAAEIRRRYGKP